MKMSPPIGVMIILAVGIASTAWLAPLSREKTQTNVALSNATYQKLSLWGKANAGTDGRAQTVAQVIEVLTNNLKNGIEVPENLAGTNLIIEP
jgi:hypothetical protein